MNKYTIYCTEEQTKKAYELGAPIEVYNHFDSDDIREADIFYKDKFIELPDGRLIERITAEQMIGWLEEKGVWIHFCKPNQRPTRLSFSISNINEPFRRVFVGGEYNSREEATLAAIDAALDYLSKKK